MKTTLITLGLITVLFCLSMYINNTLMRDPEEDTDLDNNEYDGWTSPEIEEYNDDEYDY